MQPPTPTPEINSAPLPASLPASPPGPLNLAPGWALFAALVLAVPLGTLLLTRPEPVRIPVLVELPEFSLVDHRGQAFGRAELRGRVWIANFVFTSCASACPRLTQKLRGIQDRLTPAEQRGAIGLLSISVDPERDTPAKLAQYAEGYGAKYPLWRFVTGPEREVERTVVQGFKMVMQKVPPVAAAAPAASPAAADSDDEIRAQAIDILHGERLVLVDAQGRIRGYYEADDPGITRLVRDARLLASGGA